MEKYLALAQEASTADDRVAAEGFFQHAEHYYRVMMADGRDLEERERRARPQPASSEDEPRPDMGGNESARIE